MDDFMWYQLLKRPSTQILLKTSFPQPHSYHLPSTDGFYFANLIPSPGSGMQICQEPSRNDTSREGLIQLKYFTRCTVWFNLILALLIETISAKIKYFALCGLGYEICAHSPCDDGPKYDNYQKKFYIFKSAEMLFPDNGGGDFRHDDLTIYLITLYARTNSCSIYHVCILPLSLWIHMQQ